MHFTFNTLGSRISPEAPNVCRVPPLKPYRKKPGLFDEAGLCLDQGRD